MNEGVKKPILVIFSLLIAGYLLSVIAGFCATAPFGSRSPGSIGYLQFLFVSPFMAFIFAFLNPFALFICGPLFILMIALIGCGFKRRNNKRKSLIILSIVPFLWAAFTFASIFIGILIWLD